jgi:hypothetical protein
MASLVEEKSHATALSTILVRGLAAAHGALLGALFLFLLHAPSQILVAVSSRWQAGMTAAPGQEPDLKQIELSLASAVAGFVLAVAVFFLFPLIQGGILGQVHDRLESPHQRPGRFGIYGKAFYLRLLGCEGLFVAAMMAIMIPVVFLGATLAMQEIVKEIEPVVPEEGTPSPPPLDPQEFNRHFLLNPVMLICMVIASLLATAAAVVYWVACSAVVSEQERVVAAWRKSFQFCQRNFSAAFVVCLLTFAVEVLISPLSMVAQLGIVKDVGVLVALGLLYAALIGYVAVLMAGLIMSLYLGRRLSVEERAQKQSVLA